MKCKYPPWWDAAFVILFVIPSTIILAWCYWIAIRLIWKSL